MSDTNQTTTAATDNGWKQTWEEGNDPSLTCDRCGKHVPEGDGRYIGDTDERLCQQCAEAAVPMVWRSTDDPATDDWTIESIDEAVYGTLAGIAGRLPSGDYYLAERDDEEPWTVVTADGTVRIAQCPTEEEAVALIWALRGTEGAR